MKEPETDEEIVEFCRREMQGIIDRTDWDAPSREALLDSAGLPHHEVRLIAADLTELGRFDLKLPTVYTATLPSSWPTRGLATGSTGMRMGRS